VTCFDMFGEQRQIEQMVVTAAAGGDPARQEPVQRLDRGQFTADLELRPGRNRLAAVARASDGTRLRAALDLDLPGR
jgi:hypothetical protein